MNYSTTLLITLALALASSAHAGLITDPLGAQSPSPASTTLGNPTTILPGGIIDGGLTTDPLGADAPSGTASPTHTANTKPKAAIDFTSAKKWINDLIGSQPEGEALRLSHLMMIPDVFEALHATGREADELRGYMDWLLMTGVVVGLDGDDGLDDLTGDPEDGIILGGPGGDTVHPQAPVNGIILGGPGGDTVHQRAPVNGIILGGPGNDNVRQQAPVNGYVFGTTSYMTGAPQAPVNGIILGGPGSDTLRPQPPANGYVDPIYIKD